VTKSNSPITLILASSGIDSWPGMLPGERVEATNIATEYDYTRTMGIRMLEGRDFSPEFPTDTSAIILNQAAVDAMNLKHPLGEKITMWSRPWTVVGVMDDVTMGSGFDPVGPLVMTMDSIWSTTLSLRIPKTRDMTAAVKKVEAIFHKYNPEYPFQYRFADAEFQQKFNAIEMISRMAGIFTLLAMVITSLGLFGMAAFTAERRTREIGIRKVLGATVSSIVVMLTRDFSRLVIIAFLVTAPVAWWAGNEFLQRYPLRTGIPWWIFPIAGLVTLLLTLLVVSSQAIRAARVNPAHSLKSE
jgi:ABC-type antimicrobial peptide transport system permease subunit